MGFGLKTITSNHINSTDLELKIHGLIEVIRISSHELEGIIDRIFTYEVTLGMQAEMKLVFVLLVTMLICLCNSAKLLMVVCYSSLIDTINGANIYLYR